MMCTQMDEKYVINVHFLDELFAPCSSSCSSFSCEASCVDILLLLLHSFLHL